MGALKDLADAITAAGPPREGRRRYILVGGAFGPAYLAEMGIKAEGRPWRDLFRDVNRLGTGSPAYIPTDDFPGFEIVDRVQVLKSVWL